MSATDELVELLKERGFECKQVFDVNGRAFTRWWSPLFGSTVEAEEDAGLIVLFGCYMSPGLAVEATIGRSWDDDCENVELRELVRDMWRHGMCECEERQDCTECKYGFLDRMRNLGIEVE